MGAGVSRGTPKVRLYVPAAQKAPVQWRYTFGRPSPEWFHPLYDDSKWPVGTAPFGDADFADAQVRTRWERGDIWLRRTFKLPDPVPEDIVFWLQHDDDVELYVNGVRAGQNFRSPRNPIHATNAYYWLPMTMHGRGALRPGTNLLAVHCRDFGGRAFIDVGLAQYPFFDLPITTGVQRNPRFRRFATEVRRIMEANLFPCGTVAVMKGNDVVASYGIGYLDLQGLRPLPPNALMRTASVDKPITRAAIYMLEREGWELRGGLGRFSRKTAQAGIFQP